MDKQQLVICRKFVACFVMLLMVESYVFAQNVGADTTNPASAKQDGNESKQWWLEKPMRMIQTNLREIDIPLDLDVYVNQIKKYHANVVLFNVGGIVANYPTDLPFQYRNPRLKGDAVGEVVERLHSEGIRVIGRFDFSKINESLAAQRPEWLYKSVKGETVNYNGQVHTCINGGYQQEYLFKILGESIDRYPLDGVFFNMIGYVTRDYSGNYHGICQCQSCRERFKKWSGFDLPTKEDGSDPVFRKYQQFRNETSDELFYRVNRFIKAKRSDIAICTYTPAGVDIIRKESNSALARSLPEWNYSASDNVKSVLCSWKNKVVANAAVHFVDFPYRHSAVSPYLTELRIVENMVNAGWPDYYVIGPLEKQQDSLCLEIIRELYEFHARNEKWFTDIQSMADVCLVRSGGEEYEGLFRILAENQIPFDVITPDALVKGDTPRAIEDYSLVVLADMRSMDETLCAKMDNYVERGGKVLMTGQTSTCDAQGNPLGRIRLKAAGVESTFKMHRGKRGTYLGINPADKNRLAKDEFASLDLVYLDSDFLECRPADGTECLLYFIPVGMYGPPEKCYYSEVTDIPGLFHSRFGKGECVFLPWQTGRQYQQRSNHGHALLIAAALDNLLGLKRSLVVEASPLLEVTRQGHKDGDFEWAGLVNHSGQNGTAFHRAIAIAGVPLRLKAKDKIKSVRLLKAGRQIDFSQNADGWMECVVPKLERFEIVLCEYE